MVQFCPCTEAPREEGQRIEVKIDPDLINTTIDPSKLVLTDYEENARHAPT
jgi:hypothetical protein